MSTVTLAAIPYWLVEDEPVFLADRDKIAFLTVTDITGTVVTLSGSLPFNMSSGGGKIIPPVRGLLSQPVGGNVNTDEVGDLTIQFDVTPASEPARSYTYSGVTLNGREVLTKKPNFARNLTRDFVWPVEKVDFGRGKIAWFEAINYVSSVRQASFTLRTQAEIDEFLGYFYRAKGQRGEVYVPSWTHDLPLALPAANAATTIRTPGQGVYNAHSADLTRRAIDVELWDGQRFQRRVSAIAAVSDADGSDSRLTLTSGLPYALTPAQIKRISWLYCCRFATDSLTLDYLTDQVAEVQTSFKTLKDLTPE